MKYEQQLIFNSAPEWQDQYINYTSLKSAVYRAEKEALQLRLRQDDGDNDNNGERGGLLAHADGADDDDEEEAAAGGGTRSASDGIVSRFRTACDGELEKIEGFYRTKEGELYEQLEAIRDDMEQVEEEGQFGDVLDDSEDESGDSDEEGLTLLKRGSKLLKSVVGNAGSKRLSDEEEQHQQQHNYMRPQSSRRRSSSVSRHQQTRTRKRSATGSDGSSSHNNNNDSAAVLNRVASREEGEAQQQLPAEAALEIEHQIEATRRAASAGGGAGDQHELNGKPTTNNAPVPLSKRRARASSLGGSGAPSVGDVWNSNSRRAIDMRITFKLRLQALFRDLSQLKEYVSLNQTGFRKILKKFDKVTSLSLQKEYMANAVLAAYPFQEKTKASLDQALQSVVPMYAKVATSRDDGEALRQLTIQLREHVVWERNTIWREMIGLERKGWMGSSGGGGTARGERRASGPSMDKPIVMQKEVDHPAARDSYLATPLGRFRIPRWMTKETVGGIAAVVAFVSILSSNLFDRVEERNCLAILVLASIFWAAEVIPLFATSLLVPFLVVVLRVLRSTDGHDTRLTATEASKYVFSQMFTGTIVLLVGGFTLAGALSKQNIDKILASRVLALAGTRPSTVLIAYMGVACFASMWISNVAAPVLCFSLIQPILRTLPKRSTYKKALVLGIALASNLGGMASPIASPQNLIAISYMSEPLSWAQWFVVALPVATCSIFAIWALLIWLYWWDKDTTINPVRPAKEKFTSTQWFVCFVTLATVALLCIEHQLEGYVGDMGIIALIPLVIFFGSGILRKQDFDNFPWSIVFLAMGGIALGKGVLSSGLLADLDVVLERAVKGLDVWPILAIFSILALIVATFVSHSIASVLVAPIAAQIGQALEPPHPRLLIMSTALICSAGMALPVSGFPNLMAVNLEDEVGNRYLTVNDFLKAGIPASLLATAVIITLGYLMMKLIGL